MSSPGKSPRRYWLGGKRRRSQDLWFEEALDEGRWQPGDRNGWDTCWYTGMPAPGVFRRVRAGRSINHFPGNNCLTVKSRLWHTVQAHRRRLQAGLGEDHQALKRLDFLPRTWDLADEYHLFQQTAAAEPERLWISKPKAGARGRGISVLGDPAAVPTGEQWLVQEYLDRPHLIRDRKYVLRTYVLIASLDPLRAYVYGQGFAKLASARFDMADLDNLYRHLTNPDVNARNTGAEDPVVFIDFERYRAWLREQGADDAALFRRLDDMIRLTVLAARDPMLQRTRATGADPRGCYELLGMDCMVDADLRPWLLECNLSPSLSVAARPEDGGEREAEIKRALVHDLVRLVGLNEAPTRADEPSSAERILRESEAEHERRGHFRRLFPHGESDADPALLSAPRWADRVLAERVGGPWPEHRFRPATVRELLEDGRLLLHDTRNGALHEPNPTAAYIWLRASQATDPEIIADELARQAQPGPEGSGPEDIRRDLYDTLADWSAAGLLVPMPRERAHEDPTTPLPAPSLRTREHNLFLRAGSARLTLTTDCPVTAQRLEPVLAPLREEHAPPGPAPTTLRVLRSRHGYALSRNGDLQETDMGLTELAGRLFRQLFHEAPGDSEIAVRGWLLPTAGPNPVASVQQAPPAVLVLPGDTEHGLSFARELAEAIGYGWQGGALLDTETGLARALPLPVITGPDGPQTRSTPDRPLPRGADNAHQHWLPALAEHGQDLARDLHSIVIPEADDAAGSQWPDRAAAVARLLPDGLAANGQAGQEGFVDWIEAALPEIRRVAPDAAGELARELVERHPPAPDEENTQSPEVSGAK